MFYLSALEFVHSLYSQFCLFISDKARREKSSSEYSESEFTAGIYIYAMINKSVVNEIFFIWLFMRKVAIKLMKIENVIDSMRSNYNKLKVEQMNSVVQINKSLLQNVELTIYLAL